MALDHGASVEVLEAMLAAGVEDCVAARPIYWALMDGSRAR